MRHEYDILASIQKLESGLFDGIDIVRHVVRAGGPPSDGGGVDDDTGYASGLQARDENIVQLDGAK